MSNSYLLLYNSKPNYIFNFKTLLVKREKSSTIRIDFFFVSVVNLKIKKGGLAFNLKIGFLMDLCAKGKLCCLIAKTMASFNLSTCIWSYSFAIG